mgnify:FL=1
MHFVKRVFQTAVFLVNILVALMLLLSYLSSSISPTTFWPLAVFGMLYPYLLLFNVIFAVYYLLGKSHKLWLSVIVLALYFPRHWDQFQLIDHSNWEKEAGDLKVLSYNVRLFNKYGWKPDNQAKQKIFDFVKEQEADILLFQEFYHISDHPQFGAIEDMIVHSKAPYYYFERFEPATDKRFFGLAIFSKYPIVASGIVVASKTKGKARATFADIVIEKDTVRAYNLHLRSLRFVGSDYSFLQDPDQLYSNDRMVRSKEIIKKLRDAFKDRAIESEHIKAHIENCPYPVILGGDFNDPPYTYSYYQMFPILQDAFKENGFGLGFTYEGTGWLPPYRIDYLMHDNQFESRAFKTHSDIDLSDHNPITMLVNRNNKN